MCGVLDPRRGSEMGGLQASLRISRPNFDLDVELQLPERGVTALFGPSGSGKTTVLRCLAGLERAPQGRVVFRGQIWQDADLWLPTHKRPIGYVFQEASLFPHLTVTDNLRYGMRRIKHADQKRLERVVDLLGIEHLLRRKPDALSGGERQRVAIARALAVEPELLLMDEPLASLDGARKKEILPYLERLRDDLNIPVVYVSHSPDEVARLADTLVVLNAGQVAACGPLTETLSRVDLPIRLGDDVGVVLKGTVGAIDLAWHLARVDFTGGEVWVRDHGLPLGSKVRLRILARDVSLAHQRSASSIQNVFWGEAVALGDDEHPGVVLVQLRVGESVLLARVTKRAVASLGVEPGRGLWVQVKTGAVLEH